MSKVFDEMKKRQIVMEDGRYVIFYTFAPEDHLGPSCVVVPVREVIPEEQAEDN